MKIIRAHERDKVVLLHVLFVLSSHGINVSVVVCLDDCTTNMPRSFAMMSASDLSNC